MVSTQSKLYIERQRALRKLDSVLVKESTFGKLRYLLTNFEFMSVLFILTAVYFITTGIQFWMTDYWVHAMGESKGMATIYFSVAAITGPVSGVVLGGVMFARIGGFQSPKAFSLCTLIMCLGTLIGFPLPFIPNTIVQVILVWVQFFCGGFCLPALMSMQINNVPQSTKTTANSVANCVYNLLGYLPAPYIYGLVYDATGGGDSHWGMVSLECAGVLANLIMLAVLFKDKREESKIERTKDLTEPLREVKAVDLNQFNKQNVMSNHTSPEVKALRFKQSHEEEDSSPSDQEGHFQDYLEEHDGRSRRTSTSDRLKQDYSRLSIKSLYPVSVNIEDYYSVPTDEVGLNKIHSMQHAPKTPII